MEHDCFDCEYRVAYDDGGIACDRRYLEDGVIVDIDKPTLPCPVNSNINLLDTRYNSSKYIFEADDVCPICHRIVCDNRWFPLTDSKYTNYNNSDEECNVCSICFEKYNND